MVAGLSIGAGTKVIYNDSIQFCNGQSISFVVIEAVSRDRGAEAISSVRRRSIRPELRGRGRLSDSVRSPRGIEGLAELRPHLRCRRLSTSAAPNHRCRQKTPSVLLEDIFLYNILHASFLSFRLRMVIDHCAKPMIRDGGSPGWEEGMKKLAEFPNVFVKL